MEALIRQLLVDLGEDATREGLVKTPIRVARALSFLTSGYAANSPNRRSDSANILARSLDDDEEELFDDEGLELEELEDPGTDVPPIMNGGL